jgi:hypothetical protein
MLAQIYGQQTLPHETEPLMQPMLSGSGLGLGLSCAYASSKPAKSNISQAAKANLIAASLGWGEEQYHLEVEWKRSFSPVPRVPLYGAL